jgi:hypothetical protein
MRSSHTVLLSVFTDAKEPGQDPFIVIVSVLSHVVLIFVLSFAIMYTPKVSNRTLTRKYSVRLLDLHAPLSEFKPSPVRNTLHANQQTSAHSSTGGGKPTKAKLSVPEEMAKLKPAAQVLLQPDTPPDAQLQEHAPVPFMMSWLEKTFQDRKVVLPSQEPPKIATVKPDIAPPNPNLNLRDVSITSTAFLTQKMSLMPSTTTPITVTGPEQPGKQLLAMAAAPTAMQPSASVISFSDLRMEEGPVALPVANMTATAVTGTLIQGSGKDTLTSNGTTGGAGQGASSGSGAGDDLTTDHISLPQNGQFGMVVVGSSLEEMYPETAGLWGGRLTYTVYLHVGLAKSWILQYSIPRSEEASTAGTISRLEAPWATDIVRPNLAPGDINADALMVHGFINKDGRFENLAIAFPPQFALAKFVLNALQQWQFRPAMQKGQVTAVEVLLIIPES